MARKKLWLLPAIGLLLLAALVACKDDEEDETTGTSMSGVIEYKIPYYVLKGETVTMTASGIIDPRDVTYKWYISGMYSDTLTSPTITVRFPDSIGVFTVSATSYAEGYYTSSTTQTVTTVDTTYNTSLTNVPRSGLSIVDVRDGQCYSYITVGGLDWFSQNLGYLDESLGAVAFKGSPTALSLFGACYTWEEAVHGNICPEGWHVPDNADWESLASALNDGQALSFLDRWKGLGSKASADAMLNEERMWPYSADNVHANTIGWNAIPLGLTTSDAKTWSGVNEYGYWWSASEKDPLHGYYRYIYYDVDEFPVGSASKEDIRASVRCVRTHPLF